MKEQQGNETVMKRLTVVTGLSGSGKSVALHALEDEGFHCIDNLPANLSLGLIDDLLASPDEHYGKLAIGVDMRSERASTDNLTALLKALRQREDLQVDVVFLDTDRKTLVTRFSETRRKHPLSGNTGNSSRSGKIIDRANGGRRSSDSGPGNRPLISAIDDEARLLDNIKHDADIVIDTSNLTLHDLRDFIRNYVLGNENSSLGVTFQSFGFKHGAPASTDFMFDVRCLPNPHWQPELRQFTGRDEPIIDFLQNADGVNDMYEHIRDFLTRWLPLFDAENRAYLTISIGCTGGRHRSVYLTECLATHFSTTRDNVSIRHRELA